VLINSGAGFGETVSDAALAAVLPRYAEGLAARTRERAAQASAPASAPAPPALDSTVVGVWTGSVRTVAGDTPVEFEIAANGQLKARIGTRADVGTARVSTISGRLLVRIPGDLEAPNPAGMGRQMSFYLRRRGAGFGGHVTTRPPSATGLDGSVTYWAEIARRR
jgi:hypothetical protein